MRKRYNRTDEEGYNYDDFRSRNYRPSKNSVLYFFVGIIMFFVGGFLITKNTILHMNSSALSEMVGFNVPFGLVLLPLIIGIGILFFNSKSVFGWLIFVFGIVSILMGILMGLKIQFKPVSLYEGILMYGLTAAGAGLFLKSLFGKNN